MLWFVLRDRFTVESGGSAITHYPAYEVSRNSDECKRLGVDATAENTRWFLNGFDVCPR